MPIATKLDSMVTYHEELSPINSHTFLSRGLAGSCDKLKPLYLHYCNAFELFFSTNIKVKKQTNKKLIVAATQELF